MLRQASMRMANRAFYRPLRALGLEGLEAGIAVSVRLPSCMHVPGEAGGGGGGGAPAGALGGG